MKNQSFRLWGALLLTTLLLSACTGSLALYQQSLKAFNQGARLEIKRDFAPDEPLPPSVAPTAELYPAPDAAEPEAAKTPEQYFVQAYELAAKATKGEDKLRENNALGSALTLAALSAWKTGQADEAARLAGQAQLALNQEPASEAKVRDLAVSKALPGIIALGRIRDTLLAMRKIAAETIEGLRVQEFPAREAAFRKMKATYVNNFILDEQGASSLIPAITLLNQAMIGAEDHPDVVRYLVICQLSGLANWLSAIETISKSFGRPLGIFERIPTEAVWYNEQFPKFRTIRDARLRHLEQLCTMPETAKLPPFWRMRLGAGG